MPSLLDALASFNRRERHILVGWVLDRLSFPLGHEFRDALIGEIGVPVPADSYVAMDYNLNWLCGALMWSAGQVSEEKPRSVDTEDGIDLSDNSDTDLLVGFAGGAKTHVVLLEAKGYTPWGGSQLKRKTKRLNQIFGPDGRRFEHVVPYWVFVSPKPPSVQDLAAWMLHPKTGIPRHLPLPQPASHKFALARCDANGKSLAGDYWKIRHDPWPGSI